MKPRVTLTELIARIFERGANRLRRKRNARLEVVRKELPAYGAVALLLADHAADIAVQIARTNPADASYDLLAQADELYEMAESLDLIPVAENDAPEPVKEQDSLRTIYGPHFHPIDDNDKNGGRS